MRRLAVRAAGALSVVLCLAACDGFSRIGQGPEERINDAYPLSPAAEGAKAALLQTLQGSASERERFVAEMTSKLKLRALTCGKGMQPNMFTSAEDIRRHVGDPACFVQHDATLVRWLGMRRAGAVLRLPPLRPVPAAAAPFLIARENISSVSFASAAGVALVDTLNHLQVFDLASANPFYSEQMSPGRGVVGTISPNGRLFFFGEGGTLKVKESETGAVLFEHPLTAARSAAWLDDRTILLGHGTASRKPVLLDLESGQEVDVPGSQDSFTAAVALPTPSGSGPRFAFVGNRTLCVVELARGAGALEPRLLEERVNRGSSPTFGNNGLTADGARFFFSNNALTIVQLDPLELETVSFEPLRLQAAVALPGPDEILIKGYTVATFGQPQRVYVYSLKDRTLAEVDRENLLSDRFVYMGPVKTLGVIANAKVAVLQSPLETRPAVRLEAVQAALLEEANQRKLAEFQRKLEQADALSTGAYRAAGVSAIPGPIADLGRDAIVEAVGVYRGSGSATRPGEPRRTGVVDVRIRRSSRPLILVLSAYEPVRWNLISEGGSRLAAVLIASYHPSTVVGAGNARQLQIGQMYAYRRNSAEYTRLEQEVMRHTGQRIAVFQERYEGQSFAVGGS